MAALRTHDPAHNRILILRGAKPETQAMKKRMIISAGNGIPIMIHCHCISSKEKSAILIVEQQKNN